jgi:ProP effector
MSHDLTEKLAKLAAAYPKAFFLDQADRRPLKLGIHHDLLGADMALSRTEVRQAVGWYCQSPGYLAAMVEGAVRIDLNGMPAGTVTTEAIAAAVKAAQLSQKMRERRDAKAERKAVTAAVAPEQQTEKPAALKNGNAIKLSLADLRAAAARRRQATGA